MFNLQYDQRRTSLAFFCLSRGDHRNLWRRRLFADLPCRFCGGRWVGYATPKDAGIRRHRFSSAL